ncbi:IS1 family transposase [Klebsiella pneumoniae]|nr:IS1 family transposase [Klebsiella pneumoniae]
MASVSISCPSCSATDGVVRNGKSTAGHQRYLCSHCRKTWQLQFTYTASQPGTHQKIIDMAMNGVGCRATSRQRWLFYAYDRLRKTVVAHVFSKRYTQRIERHNLNLRQHLAMLGRKSLSFSKSVELHDKVIGHYLNIKHYQ